MTLRKKIANMFYGIGHAFESAKVSLSRGNPNTLNPTDASAELPSYTRSELVRKARYLEKNSGHIRGILCDLKVYGIGKCIYPPVWKHLTNLIFLCRFAEAISLEAGIYDLQ